MKVCLLLLLLLFCCDLSWAEIYRVKSPDRKLEFIISNMGDSLCYQVSYDAQEVLAPSRLKWSVDGKVLGDCAKQLSLAKKYKGNDRYATWGTHSVAIDKYNGFLFHVVDAEGKNYDVEVRLFNEGVAFRYGMNGVGKALINEYTTFNLPAECTLWSQKDIRGYEGAYRQYTPSTVPVGISVGLPMTHEFSKGLYCLISEANLYNYPGLTLRAASGGRFSSVLNGKAEIEGAVFSPWRCLVVGDLNAIVNNDVITNLSEPENRIFQNDDDWVKAGKCVWSWLANYPVTFENMKKFTDWAYELGFHYNLVDEGWSYWKEGDKDGWQLMKELSGYGNTKGVKTLIWKAYCDRKGIPGIQTYERRDEFFKKCKEAGVAGVKLDFFDSEDQEITRYYKETLEHAAKYKLLVIYHGCDKPTGLSRTFPNEMSREGIMGLEYGCSWADQNTVFPFTRFAAGHADYTPFTLLPGMMGKTSAAHQFATSLLFTSPLLCYGGRPEDYLASPMKEYVCSVPTVWDETVVLKSSRIGELAAVAKRNGNEWWLAVITLKPQTQLSLSLDFLGKKAYSMDCIKDNLSDQYDVAIDKNLQVNSKTILNLDLREEGGFVARLR